MKKSIFILLVIISIFIASCSPQVTVTSEVTVTLPTATQTPEPTATSTAVYTSTPASEVITGPKGLQLELGAPVDGQEGAFVITSMTNGKDWTASINADTRLGFNPEDNQWIAIKKPDGTTKVVLQRVSDHTQIAELKPSGTVSWDWAFLVNSNDQSIPLRGAIVLEKKNILSSLSAQNKLLETVTGDLPINDQSFTISRRILYSKDGKHAVLVDFIPRGDNPQAGFVLIRGADGKPIVIWTENFDLELPFVTR